MTDWSYEVPNTGVGRVWATSARSDPSVRTNRQSSSVATWSTSEQNVRQRSWGSTPRSSTTPAVPGGSAPTELVGRPVDHPAQLLVQAHVGSGIGEVVELLGVDRGERGRLPALPEVLDRPRGGVTGVVPALERHHHDRTAVLGSVGPSSPWSVRPAEVPHPASRYRSDGVLPPASRSAPTSFRAMLIEECEGVTDELVAAMERLVPQLSSSSPPPSAAGRWPPSSTPTPATSWWPATTTGPSSDP